MKTQILKFEKLQGLTISGVYHGHNGIYVILGDDEYFVISAGIGYENEAYPIICDTPVELSWDLVGAGIATEEELKELREVEAQARADKRREQELQRLAYLKEKYEAPLS